MAGTTRFPRHFCALLLLVGAAGWLVHAVPPGKYVAADRVRMAIRVCLAAVTPAKAETAASASPSPAAPQAPLRTVARVVDGDTLVLDGGEKVRLIGINTPESVDPRKPVQWYGKEASAYATKLLLGRKVRVEADVEPRDRYGRTLAYLWLEDGTFVNLRLVEDGFAFSYPYPPNVKHEAEFREAERRARMASRGLWSDIRRAEEILPKKRR